VKEAFLQASEGTLALDMPSRKRRAHVTPSPANEQKPPVRYAVELVVVARGRDGAALGRRLATRTHIALSSEIDITRIDGPYHVVDYDGVPVFAVLFHISTSCTAASARTAVEGYLLAQQPARQIAVNVFQVHAGAKMPRKDERRAAVMEGGSAFVLGRIANAMMRVSLCAVAKADTIAALYGEAAEIVSRSSGVAAKPGIVHVIFVGLVEDSRLAKHADLTAAAAEEATVTEAEVVDVWDAAQKALVAAVYKLSWLFSIDVKHAIVRPGLGVVFAPKFACSECIVREDLHVVWSLLCNVLCARYGEHVRPRLLPLVVRGVGDAETGHFARRCGSPAVGPYHPYFSPSPHT
jgi:hypothetical protein